MKKVNSVADLAINGADPAFTEPLHVGRPNIGDKSRFLSYVDDIFESGWLTNNGPLVQELEQQVAALHDVEHCVAMSNGTIALEIAIRALGMEGEVIVPSYTFVATAHALHWQAITPVFADIDPTTHTLDPESVRSMITPRTTGIIGVHLWGHPAPVADLTEIAEEHALSLMFDSAHAFGGTFFGKKVGNFGRCEVLSFHATKWFNTFEGGAVLTNDSQLASKIRLMRNFGFDGIDNVIYPGTNGKMCEISAAMGLVNLAQLDSVGARNKRNYDRYKELLGQIDGISLLDGGASEGSSYQYVVAEVASDCGTSRDSIVNALHAENILARRYFWPGCHRMMPYRELYPHAGLLLRNTEMVAERVIVLPTGTVVNDREIELIASVIKTVIEHC